MNQNTPINDAGDSIPANAVSVYGQADAMDDFPILKAFQQYVDAEQAKAHKRMTALCVFFALLMTAVIGVFVLLLMNVSQRNNALNDQLIGFMMKDRERSQVVVQQPPVQNDTTIKALTDTVANLQKQLADQQSKAMEQQTRLMEQQARNFEERAKRLAAEANKPKGPTKEQMDIQAKNKSDAEKIKRAAAIVAEEKEKVAKEKERLRQMELELQRRRLYPELYDDDGNLVKRPPAKKQAATAKPAAKKDDTQFKPVKYFNDDDDELDLDLDGSTSKWTVPLD
jgi:cell division protein FtsI/penicillin-binding protein 2